MAVIKSMNISVYADGNNILFQFENVSEEQKKELLAFGEKICNAGVNVFTTLAPKEMDEKDVPKTDNMEQVAATMPAQDVAEDMATEKTTEGKEPDTGTDEPRNSSEQALVYEMDKETAGRYLAKNLDSGAFVGFGNLIRAYFVAAMPNVSRDTIEENLSKGDEKAMFEKNKAVMLEFAKQFKNAVFE